MRAKNVLCASPDVIHASQQAALIVHRSCARMLISMDACSGLVHASSSTCMRALGPWSFAQRRSTHTRRRERFWNDPLACSPRFRFAPWACRLPEQCARLRWATSMMYFEVPTRSPICMLAQRICLADAMCRLRTKHFAISLDCVTP